VKCRILLEVSNSPINQFRNIQKRTKLLITFGSPLDKIAFLFRIKKDTDELREAAAAAWQPLITSYKFRPQHWFNIYSWMDLFSAPLRFYDNLRFGNEPCPQEDGGDERVLNRADPQAWVPLVAHTEYWTDDILGDALCSMISEGTTMQDSSDGTEKGLA
jgi:hypothetical protein